LLPGFIPFAARTRGRYSGERPYGVNILVVEDEKGVARFIKKGLEEEGYMIDLAANGEDGLALVSRNLYDLIILDIMLPGMSGIDLCRSIRQMNIHSPVLMLTARDSVHDKVAGLDSGADDYLTKPFSFEEFLARIRALLRRKPDQLTELRYRDMRVETITHKVFIGEEEVPLRPKEYALLIYLLRNRGRPVSRTKLLADVWGYDFNPSTNVVDVHIKSLREKLGVHSQTHFIQSVRGVGYSISD
jgi:DNA-binding response OmpR family regulator